MCCDVIRIILDVCACGGEREGEREGEGGVTIVGVKQQWWEMGRGQGRDSGVRH